MADQPLNYERSQIDRILSAGPGRDDERNLLDHFTVKISGKLTTRNLSATRTQVEAIREIMAVEG